MLLRRILCMFLVGSCLFLYQNHCSSPKASKPAMNYSNTYPRLPDSYAPKKKKCCLILYMAGDNDLRTFLYRNIEEIQFVLRKIGNDAPFHLFIHTDTHNPGHAKKTVHLIAHQGALMQVGDTQAMDSGQEQTLIFTYEQALKYCPADQVIVGLWNHGTGALNPLSGRTIHPTRLCTYDPETNLVSLDRSIGFIDLMELLVPNEEPRGICFDESTGNYLSNQKVGHALEIICKKYRNGKPIDMLFCDACLMGCAEFAYEIRKWVNILVASQEVILATGYRYDHVLAHLALSDMPMQQFSTSLVELFKNAYSQITHDFTLSAIDLSMMDPVSNAINQIADILIEGLQKQWNHSVREFIKKSSSKALCTHFNEPSYKDASHLFRNFIYFADLIDLGDSTATRNLKTKLINACQNGCKQIAQAAIAHTAGRNLAKSAGLSLYLPDRRLHPSYLDLSFAKETQWKNFILAYLNS